MKAALCGILALLLACASPAKNSALVWVNVRTIDLVGVDEKDRPAILALQVPLTAREGGFVEGWKDSRAIRLTIADLGSGAERRLESGVLQLIVETIAAYYSQQERIGTRADIRRSDFKRMLEGETRLRIYIKEPSKPSGT
jgi:hypothetical protein